MGEITIREAGPDRLDIWGQVRPDGRYDWPRIRSEIACLTSERRHPSFRWPHARARRAVLEAARRERRDVLRALQRQAESRANAAVFDQSARDLAARYNHDTAVLRFECDRRRFGSLTTTLAARELPRFERALDIAIARHQMAEAAE